MLRPQTHHFRHWISLFFLLQLVYSPSSIFGMASDTVLSLYQGERLVKKSWYKHYVKPLDSAKIRFVNNNPICGKAGILISRASGPLDDVYFEAKTDFRKESWQRFYLRVDSAGTSIRHDTAGCTFINYLFYTWTEKEQPSSTIDFILLEKGQLGSPFKFVWRLRPSVKPQFTSALEQQLEAGKSYCFETHLLFTDTDSLKAELYVNGRYVGLLASRYVFNKEFFTIRLMPNYNAVDLNQVAIYLENIAFSDRRISALPPIPSLLPKESANFSPILCLAPFSSVYLDEKLSAVRYQLALDSTFLQVVYDRTVTDPAFFEQLKIPFELDSGSYYWRASYKNNFSFWGDWSAGQKLFVGTSRPVVVRLNRIFLSAPGRREQLQSLLPEHWYDIHLQYDSLPLISDGYGYALISLHHPEYTEGNISNKGGRFFPAENYIWNMSFPFSGQDSFILYEKQDTGSFKTTALSPGTHGLYVDGRKGLTLIDTLHKEIRLRVKLLRDAKPGKWFLSGLIVAPVERFSNYISIVIEVKPMKSGMQRRILPLLLLGLLVLALLVWVFKYRKQQAPQILDASLVSRANKHLVKYIEEHISEKLNVDKIKQDLRINRRIFYEMLKEGGVDSLPKLVNAIKIEQAKKLLLSSNKSISEISNELGFENSRYFSTLFKDYTKLTPSDFKHSFQK